MQANRLSATWFVSAATRARVQRWATLLALLHAILPGCVHGSLELPATDSAAGAGSVGSDFGAGGDSLGGGVVASGGVVAEIGGQDVGTGGEDAGTGGEDVGTGGEEVGSGGDDVGTGGEVVGTGGEVVGTGGEVVGGGGQAAGAGGQVVGGDGGVAGAGGEVVGAGGQIPGAGGAIAGAGGAVAGAGGGVAGAGGDVAGAGGQVVGSGGQATGGSGTGGTVYAACPGDAADAYLENPSSIPGTIEAEDFDSGGYSDTTAGNEGGAYRTDVDVDIKEFGNGFAVGWMTAGEWLEYTVSVPLEGDYGVTVLAGAVDADRTLELSQCGTSLTGPIAVPQIADWGEVGTTTASSVHLSAGLQVIRVTVGASDYIDFDSMTIE